MIDLRDNEEDINTPAPSVKPRSTLNSITDKISKIDDEIVRLALEKSNLEKQRIALKDSITIKVEDKFTLSGSEDKEVVITKIYLSNDGYDNRDVENVTYMYALQGDITLNSTRKSQLISKIKRFNGNIDLHTILKF